MYQGAVDRPNNNWNGRTKSGKFELLGLGRTIGQVRISEMRRPEKTHYGLEIISPDFMGFMIDRLQNQISKIRKIFGFWHKWLIKL